MAQLTRRPEAKDVHIMTQLAATLQCRCAVEEDSDDNSFSGSTDIDFDEEVYNSVSSFLWCGFLEASVPPNAAASITLAFPWATSGPWPFGRRQSRPEQVPRLPLDVLVRATQDALLEQSVLTPAASEGHCSSASGNTPSRVGSCEPSTPSMSGPDPR